MFSFLIIFKQWMVFLFALLKHICFGIDIAFWKFPWRSGPLQILNDRDILISKSSLVQCRFCLTLDLISFTYNDKVRFRHWLIAKLYSLLPWHKQAMILLKIPLRMQVSKWKFYLCSILGFLACLLEIVIYVMISRLTPYIYQSWQTCRV